MITTTGTKVIYLGNGAAREYPITFGYADPTTVKVGIYDPATDQTVELTKDYYVDTVRNAVFYPGYAPGQAPPESEQPGPLPAGKKLVVYRATPMDQTIDLGTKYPLPIIEKIGDKNTLIEQELAEKLGRAVLADIGSGKTVEDIQREIREDRLATEKAANEAQEAKTASGNNADLAQAWAEAPHSPNGAEGSKSAKMWAKEALKYGAAEAEKAKHWADEAARIGAENVASARSEANKSAASANDAQEAKAAAQRQADLAQHWAKEASDHAGEARVHREHAESYANHAEQSKQNAQYSEDHAAAAKTGADKSAAEAKLAAEEAASSAEKAKQIAGGDFATPKQVDEKIAALVNQAPEMLNTLSEIATALGNDPNFATTITGLIGQKLGRNETASSASSLHVPGSHGAIMKGGAGILVLQYRNGGYYEMVPTPGSKITVGTAQNCVGNAETATTAKMAGEAATATTAQNCTGNAATATTAFNVPMGDHGGDIWIA